jgi:type IV fimbrial biogenesis protein FimT
MDKRSASAGFTLIELMVVVAIAALLQSLAAPAFRGMVNSMRLTAAVNSLFTSLLLARSEAIKRNGRAVVCKTVTGEACVTTGGWQQGWIVFHDVNNNARRDAGEVIVSHQQATAAPILLTGNSPLVSYVSYTPMGQTAYASGAFQAGTLTVCVASSSSQEARQIIISSAGRPRTIRTTVAHCPL